MYGFHGTAINLFTKFGLAEQEYLQKWPPIRLYVGEKAQLHSFPAQILCLIDDKQSPSTPSIPGQETALQHVDQFGLAAGRVSIPEAYPSIRNMSSAASQVLTR